MNKSRFFGILIITIFLMSIFTSVVFADIFKKHYYDDDKVNSIGANFNTSFIKKIRTGQSYKLNLTINEATSVSTSKNFYGISFFNKPSIAKTNGGYWFNRHFNPAFLPGGKNENTANLITEVNNYLRNQNINSNIYETAFVYAPFEDDDSYSFYVFGGGILTSMNIKNLDNKDLDFGNVRYSNGKYILNLNEQSFFYDYEYIALYYVNNYFIFYYNDKKRELSQRAFVILTNPLYNLNNDSKDDDKKTQTDDQYSPKPTTKSEKPEKSESEEKQESEDKTEDTQTTGSSKYVIQKDLEIDLVENHEEDENITFIKNSNLLYINRDKFHSSFNLKIKGMENNKNNYIILRDFSNFEKEFKNEIFEKPSNKIPDNSIFSLSDNTIAKSNQEKIKIKDFSNLTSPKVIGVAQYKDNNNKADYVSCNQNSSREDFLLDPNYEFDYLIVVPLNNQDFIKNELYLKNLDIINNFYSENCLPYFIDGSKITQKEQERPEPDNDDSDGCEIPDDISKDKETIDLSIKTCFEYIEILKDNLDIFDLESIYTPIDYGEKDKDKSYDKILDDFYKERMTIVTDYPNRVREYSEIVFDVANAYGFSEEETAQFWSILASETKMKINNFELDNKHAGIAQIYLPSHCKKNSSKFAISNKLQLFNKSKLKNNLNKELGYIKENSLYDSLCEALSDYDHSKVYSSVIYAAAIYKLNQDALLADGRDFPLDSIKYWRLSYDHSESIDMMFGSAYKYALPSRGFTKDSRFNSSSLKPNTTYLIHKKLAYYLVYKKLFCYYEKGKLKNDFKDLETNFIDIYKKFFYNSPYKNEIDNKTSYQTTGTSSSTEKASSETSSSQEETSEEETSEKDSKQISINDIKDNNLKKCINDYLASDDIDEISDIKYLDCSNKNISNLKGIELLTNLKVLDLSNNQISDIQLISKLIKLKELYIENNYLNPMLSCSSQVSLSFGNSTNLYNCLPNTLTKLCITDQYKGIVKKKINSLSDSVLSEIGNNLININTADLKYERHCKNKTNIVSLIDDIEEEKSEKASNETSTPQEDTSDKPEDETTDTSTSQEEESKKASSETSTSQEETSEEETSENDFYIKDKNLRKCICDHGEFGNNCFENNQDDILKYYKVFIENGVKRWYPFTKDLNCSGYGISDLTGISTLKTIEILDLSNNELDQDSIEKLFYINSPEILHSLKYLNLNNATKNGIDNLDFLYDFTELEYLDLRNNNIKAGNKSICTIKESGWKIFSNYTIDECFSNLNYLEELYIKEGNQVLEIARREIADDLEKISSHKEIK